MTPRGNENAAYAAKPEVKAFLDMIARAEGTYGVGDNGYNILYGFGRFTDYSKHPNKAVKKGGWTSTAAGRYQFLYRTWAPVKTSNGLPDFSPGSQDIGAVELLRQRGALPKILAGDIAGAISKARKEWASFPGAGYGQGERSLSTMLNWYAQDLAKHGGTPVSSNTPGSAGSATKITEAGAGPLQVILIVGFAFALIAAYLNYR